MDRAQLLQHFDTLAETPEAVVKSELILYQTEDNRTRIEVRLENETVWLTQAQILQATHFKKAELAKAEG